MDVLAYFITLANLQHLNRMGSPLKDTSVHLGTLYELKKELFNMPDFPIEGYRKNGIQKHGNVAVYPSKTVRDYIFDGQGSPNDEGVIIKLNYGDNSDPDNVFDFLAYFIYRDNLDGKQHDGDDIEGGRPESVVLGRRIKRSFLDKLIPST